MSYKLDQKPAASFLDFNQPLGFPMDMDNRWVKMADYIPWDDFEKEYLKMFPNKIDGNVAKPLRLALGCILIQEKYKYSNRELGKQLIENPYYQYFIGLPGYQKEAPIHPTTLRFFKERIGEDMMRDAWKYMKKALGNKLVKIKNG